MQQLWQYHLLLCQWLESCKKMRATRISHHMAPLRVSSLIIITLTEQIAAPHKPCHSISSHILQPWLIHQLGMTFWRDALRLGE